MTSISSLQIKKDATTIITRIQGASDILVPLDNSITSLEEVVPSFSASFTFENPDGPPMNFVLEMISSSALCTVYEKAQELWTRMDRRDNAVPLEAFMARLDGCVLLTLFIIASDVFVAGLLGSFKSLPRTASIPVESIQG